MNLHTEQNDGTFPEIIAEFIPIPLIVESLSACLNATTTSRNGTTVPDCRTRLETAKLILGNMVGTPTPRKEAVPIQENSNDGRNFEDLIMHSPILLKQVKDTLERVEARKAKIDV